MTITLKLANKRDRRQQTRPTATVACQKLLHRQSNLL